MEFELDIVKYVPPGDGLGYHNGKTVFVPATTPGDRVRVFSVKENKRSVTAALQEVIVPAAERCDPPCPHYDQCGGCSLMHLDYERQLSLKEQMASEIIRSHGLDQSVPVDPSPERFQFRYKTRIRCVEGQLGFSGRRSHHIVETPGCLILPEAILNTLAPLANLGRATAEYHILASLDSGSVTVAVQEGNRIVPLPGFPLSVREDYGFGQLTLPSDGFAQSNPFVTTNIISDLLQRITDNGSVSELFCGCGTFSLPLAATGHPLQGVDLNPSAIDAATKNAAELGLTDAGFRVADINRLKRLPAAGTILVDPPRKGLGKDLCRLITKSKSKQLLYVSCNPASLARDMKLLTIDGGFSIDDIKGYDMYCHSTHLELLAVLSR